MNKFLLWFFAILITFGAAYYQRKTGPTYPKQEKIAINKNEYKFEFIRSHGGTTDAEVLLSLPKDVSGVLKYKKYPSNETYETIQMTHNGEHLEAELPNQPPAGKLEYFVELKLDDKVIFENSAQPIVIRFKGDVPAYVLIPHVFFMFFAMLLSTLTALFAINKYKSFKIYGIITLFFLIIGGGILGPIVQKFAFGEFWTGVPLGWDLTDNKTLIGLIGWIVAVAGNIKKERQGLAIGAAILLLIIYSIPHSMFGSELNHETGEVIQGVIFNPLLLM